MILATTRVEDMDRFLEVYSTKGAEKRAQHGSKGSTVFRDPTEENTVWVVFDWDVEGWQSFVSDPDVPGIMQLAGHIGKPQAPELIGQYDAQAAPKAPGAISLPPWPTPGGSDLTLAAVSRSAKMSFERSSQVVYSGPGMDLRPAEPASTAGQR